ncbi:uncharacterized protein LOC133899579 isoform X4 [Phragmites australis]|uniref:uncharacterized protein LOC133899579 isoform X4 n=1 Tax=Phragmites australis TaxID=29695 RepID=UPI002D79C828|nr:uncharacterized protein LOC133899579 isoform X4 [Phragmites australis]
MDGFGNDFFSPRNADDVFPELFGSRSVREVKGMEYLFPNEIFHFHSRNHRFSPRFAGFFGSRSGSSSSSIFGTKPPAVETKLPCKLEDLYAGATRKMKISRSIVKPNGQLGTETEVLTINIKPGWKKGTKITFPDKGNKQPNQLPADIVFIIDEEPHDVYTREGNDLLVYKKIDLVDALAGTTVNLKTLDGRDLAIQIIDVVTPGHELVIAKEGMPFSKENGRRGNLRIQFDVNFPKRLSAEQRRNIRKDLGGQPQQQ